MIDAQAADAIHVTQPTTANEVNMKRAPVHLGFGHADHPATDGRTLSSGPLEIRVPRNLW